MISIKGKFAAVTGAAVLLGVAILAISAVGSHSGSMQGPESGVASADIFAAASAKTSALERFRKSPMMFEANEGQTDKRVKFISRGAGYTLFLTDDSAV